MFENWAKIATGLVMLASLSSATAFAGDAQCERPVSGSLKTLGHYSAAATQADFDASSRVIFRDSIGPDPAKDCAAFYVSNEMDWFKMPVDREPTDVVVGFGTNTAWDIAVRKNAKMLVIGDWVAGPLIGQEYLIRPLVLAAKSPGEFMSMLGAAPIDPALFDRPVEEAFSAVYRVLGAVKTDELQEKRRELADQVIARLVSDPRITDLQIIFVKKYFETLLDRSNPARPRMNPTLPEHTAPPFSDLRFLTPETDYIQSYLSRYHRGWLVADEGADPSILEDPYFSSFSSKEAFARLKRLFDGNVYYAKSSFDNSDLYATVRKLGDGHGYSKYTVSVSNILSVIYFGDKKAQDAALKKYMEMTAGKLGASARNPLYGYCTVGRKIPHGFELHRIPE